MRRILACTALLVLALTGTGAGQDAPAQRTWPPWRTSFFPYPAASPNDGLTGIIRVLHFRQAPYDDRLSLVSGVAAEVGYSTRGSWLAHVRADLPRIAPGWRMAGLLGAREQPHFGVPEDSLQRQRFDAWIDVTRRLGGAWQFAIRLAAQQSNISGEVSTLTARYPTTPLDGCVFQGSCGSRYEISEFDAQARAAVVIDLRDREYDTRRGALVEAGLFVGAAANGYTGGYALARGWATPREGSRLTARAGLRSMSATQAAGALHEIPGWEHPVTVLGGVHSHRGLGDGELVGRGVLLAGVEARHDVMNFGNIGSVTLLGFVDGGRVFVDPSPLVDPVPGAPLPSGALELTLDGWTVGAGGGVSLRLLRNAQLTMTVGRANERTRLYVSAGTAW
jgi:hypothetical protein